MSEYDADIVMWSEHQAELLRRVAAGEPVNEPLDWTNIIEEVGSVGREQQHAVESLLLRALIHILKAEAWPLSREVPHWQAEARVFLSQARRRFAPSMRQYIDLSGIYADALQGIPETIDDQALLPIPQECPVTLDELLGKG